MKSIAQEAILQGCILRLVVEHGYDRCCVFEDSISNPTLDERGYPYEVMIYDGRDTFKYRGVLAYDGSGRFKEEQLYDPKGTLIRRKIQEYTQQGQRLPLKSVDYVANVPEDLKLVITREEEQTGSNPEDKPQKTGLFSKKPEQAQGSAQPQQAASSAPKMKGLKLGRMFGGKKKDK